MNETAAPSPIVPKLPTGARRGEGGVQYRRFWRSSVVLTAVVSLAPIVIMTVLSYYQFRKALLDEMVHPTSLLLANSKRSLEFFIDARVSALRLLAHDTAQGDVCDQAALVRRLRNVTESFGGFVDLGIVREDGIQCAYVGPYALRGKDYTQAGWFNEVGNQGQYVSDVFLGYSDVPHFVIAVRQDEHDGTFHVLRATVGADLLAHYAVSVDLEPTSDAFIVNHRGILQTPSRFHGRLLRRSTVPVPPVRSEPQVLEQVDRRGRHFVLGYAYIERSPFVLVMIKRAGDPVSAWLSERGETVGFLATSVVLILIVILWSSTVMVARLREADRRRTQILHNIEYTNKMATIGRLAAGVSHEINNPLAIINEKAGLLGDILAMNAEMPRKKELSEIVGSIQRSVERCSAITHRLLGFAKRMDVRTESIQLEGLLREVLTFLGKEAEHRGIAVTVHPGDDVPTVDSDRGQLQQVFLNIVNNAVAAVSDGGRIDIHIARAGEDGVAVRIEDNGRGISPENLRHIFEPFFTTKGEYGTGLGLSITYGIVEKLGGKIEVRSELGKGTSFTVTLPVRTAKF